MADKKKAGAQAGQSKGNAPAHKRDDRDGGFAKGASRGPRRDKPEMDEAIKHIPKVTKPNRDAFADEVKAFDDKIQHLTNQLKDVQTRINTANRDKGALYAKKEEIFAQLKGIGAAVAQAKENRKKFVNEIKSLSETRARKLEELQKLKEKLPPKLRGEGRGFNLKATLDDIDLKIGKLENKLKVSTLTLAEEKAVVAKISSLLNAKKVAKEYDQEWQKIRGTLDSDNQPSQEKRSHLSALIKEQEDKIVEVRASEEKLQKELEDVRNKLKQVTDSIPGLLEKREQLRQEKDQTFAARGEVFKRKNEAEAQFKEYMVKVNEVRAVEWKKNQEKRAVERAQRAEEDLKNQLNAIPFEEERSTCDVLIAYLQQYLIKPEEEEEHAENNNNPTTASPATPEGAVVLKRDEVEQFAPVKAKAKKQKKPKAPVLKPDSLLKHDLAVLRQFEILSLACPLKAADVPKSIEDINLKKEHFTKLGVEKKKQLEAEYARKQEEKAKEAQQQADAQKVDGDPKSDQPETTAITDTQEALSTEVQS
jgi:uncharacterized coiled-coil DUF342 family protein